ncbi:hypothetical protein AgCh_034001 [Apium graveolens]
MQDCSSASTPMATATKLDKDTGKSVDVTDYRDPREPRLTAVKRIFKYLKGTADLGLWYPRESDFKLIGNSVQHSMTKHISIRYHFIREHVDEGTVELHFGPTDQQLADIFIKPLCEATFTRLVNELGIISVNLLNALSADKPHLSKEKARGSKNKIRYNMFLNYETFNMELSCADWQQEWHVTAIPDEIWDSVPQEVLTHTLFFYMDYHRHLERLEEERLEALRQYNIAENGLLHVPKGQTSSNAQAQMFSDPNMAMDMMKKNLSMIIPHTLTFAWVNFFFSGFVAAKIPFPMTQRFRSMLQNGIDLSIVDVSYVSSRSWYSSSVGYALTQLSVFSSQQVLTFWRTGHFDNGGTHCTPSIVFEVGDSSYIVTPGTICKALHLPEGCTFSIPEESALQDLMASLGYEQSLAKLGQLKRAHIRREWSFFFDCITKAFGNKCSNFDALPIMSQHIGYAIINQTHFDFATAIIGFIGDRMTEDRNVVYFARFCQLIYTFCTDEPQLVSSSTPPFKVAKRYFNDLINADTKKSVVRPLQIPQSVKQILVNDDPNTYRSVYSDVQPTTTTQTPQQPSATTTHSTQPTLRQYIKSYLSTSQTVQPSTSVPTVKSSSSKPKRTKTVPQTPKKRRRIALRDESDTEDQVPSSEPVIDEAEKETSQKDSGIGGSRLLKRLRRMTEAAKEGDQESLISQEKEFAKVTSSPSTPSQEAVSEKASTPSVSPVDPGTSADIDVQNLVVPEVIFLEAPTAYNPSTTPVTDAVQTPELSTTPSLHLDTDDQNLGEHQDMAVDQNLEPDQQLEDAEASITTHTIVLSEDNDSVNSDAANAGDTGDAAPNVDADVAEKHQCLGVKLLQDKWNSVSCVPTEKHLAEHLTKADEMLNSDDFKTQLRVTALSTKHLQGLHLTTHAELHKIQEEFIKQEQVQKIDKKKFFQPTFDRIAYIEKTQEKQQAQINDILTNQASQQSQLTEIQASVELLVSLLLPADAKKGEKVIKSKCKTDKTQKEKDNEKDDQGRSRIGRGHSQGRGFTSRKAEITSHRTSSDTGKRISSATGKRISSDELLDLDEEMSRQLFLQENPGMDLESLMEEEDRLKSEKVTSKSEASDPRSKGKEKVGEPIKVYVPPENEEITDEKDDLALTSRKVLKTTSNMAQVVQSQDKVSSDISKKQVTSDTAQVNLISEVRPKTLLPGFTKAKQTQPLKTAASGFEARVVIGKEARDKTGLGSADERRIQNTTNDPTSLSEPGIGATPERLNQLESVQMVYHTYLKEHILLYFMTDGRVYHIRQNAIPLKYFEELEHVLFLLQVDDRLTGTAANYLKDQIQRQKRLYSVKSDSIYVPKYRDHKGDIVEMKPNTAKIITTFLGYRAVEFNLESDKAYLIRLDQDIRKTKINDLRAAIFQIGEDTAELKDDKRKMIDELRYAERCLLKNYLRTTPDIREIRR